MIDSERCDWEVVFMFLTPFHLCFIHLDLSWDYICFYSKFYSFFSFSFSFTHYSFCRTYLRLSYLKTNHLFLDSLCKNNHKLKYDMRRDKKRHGNGLIEWSWPFVQQSHFFILSPVFILCKLVKTKGHVICCPKK